MQLQFSVTLYFLQYRQISKEAHLPNEPVLFEYYHPTNENYLHMIIVLIHCFYVTTGRRNWFNMTMRGVHKIAESNIR